ncbi:FUSC family protein [Uliginosibacterium sp. sgz301328]|uniref:FUSC family protein n=1 Tax=Uliginosibacterium sp. sgz301328 TaxID=3243764 RepID=UPI00359E6A90
MPTPTTPWLTLDRPTIAQALRLATAALIAFAIASVLHVHNAYWAAMPVWVVAQSSRGLLLERAFFRVVGTLLGAALGFAILHLTGNPYLQLVLLSCVVALGAGFTHILRGVHAYGALLTGMTAAVVVLPSMLAPQGATELALARVECTLIGVLVVTVVMALFTPDSRRDAFYRRVRQLAGDAVTFASFAVEGRADDETMAYERRVLAEMSDVDALASMVSAGSVEGYRRLRHVNALIMSAMSVMAAARAVRARLAYGEPLPEGLAPTLVELAAHLKRGGAGAVAADWAHANIEQGRLADAVRQLQDAEARLFAAPDDADARSFSRKAAYLAPHRDWALARSTGAVSGAGCLIAGGIAYVSGLPAAELTAMGVCIFSMVLGSLPVPQRAAPHMMAGVLVGVVAATFYRFAIQPHAFEGAALVLGVAPFIVLGSFMRANPRTSLAGIDANMCFMLASQAGMAPAESAHIIAGSLSLLVGAAVVTGGFVLMPRRFDRQAREVARSIRTDLRRLIGDPTPERLGGWHPQTARQVLRLMLHATRIGGRMGHDAPDGLLATLNLAHAVAILRTEAVGDGPASPAAAAALRLLYEARHAPDRTAARMADEARALPVGPVRHAMENVADCLMAALPLLRFADDTP